MLLTAHWPLIYCFFVCRPKFLRAVKTEVVTCALRYTFRPTPKCTLSDIRPFAKLWSKPVIKRVRFLDYIKYALFVTMYKIVPRIFDKNIYWGRHHIDLKFLRYGGNMFLATTSTTARNVVLFCK